MPALVMNSMRLLQGCLAGASGVLAVLLVAQLVQEDGLIGEEAMWLTRPIGPGTRGAVRSPREDYTVALHNGEMPFSEGEVT